MQKSSSENSQENFKLYGLRIIPPNFAGSERDRRNSLKMQILSGRRNLEMFIIESTS